MSGRATTASAAARRAQNKRRWFAITPPEGVPVRFEIATIAARFGAQLADVGLTVAASFALTILLALLPFNLDDATLVVFFLLMLAIRAPYYIASELFWNGQTLGKKSVRLRVLSADGRGLSTHSVVIRNLMKEVEVFVPGSMLLSGQSLGWFWGTVLLVWIAIVLGVPLLNRQRLRIGDIIANTIVVHDPKPELLPDLTDGAGDEAFVFSAAQLEHYGRFELQTLETLLRRHPLSDADKAPDPSIVAVTQQICTKIGYEEPVPDSRALAFLHAFYKAQRAFLESRQVFGDVRDDKHHSQPDTDGES